MSGVDDSNLQSDGKIQQELLIEGQNLIRKLTDELENSVHDRLKALEECDELRGELKSYQKIINESKDRVVKLEREVEHQKALLAERDHQTTRVQSDNVDELRITVIKLRESELRGIGLASNQTKNVETITSLTSQVEILTRELETIRADTKLSLEKRAVEQEQSKIRIQELRSQLEMSEAEYDRAKTSLVSLEHQIVENGSLFLARKGELEALQKTIEFIQKEREELFRENERLLKIEAEKNEVNMTVISLEHRLVENESAFLARKGELEELHKTIELIQKEREELLRENERLLKFEAENDQVKMTVISLEHRLVENESAFLARKTELEESRKTIELIQKEREELLRQNESLLILEGDLRTQLTRANTEIDDLRAELSFANSKLSANKHILSNTYESILSLGRNSGNLDSSSINADQSNNLQKNTNPFNHISTVSEQRLSEETAMMNEQLAKSSTNFPKLKNAKDFHHSQETTLAGSANKLPITASGLSALDLSGIVSSQRNLCNFNHSFDSLTKYPGGIESSGSCPTKKNMQPFIHLIALAPSSESVLSEGVVPTNKNTQPFSCGSERILSQNHEDILDSKDTAGIEANRSCPIQKNVQHFNHLKSFSRRSEVVSNEGSVRLQKNTKPFSHGSKIVSLPKQEGDLYTVGVADKIIAETAVEKTIYHQANHLYTG